MNQIEFEKVYNKRMAASKEKINAIRKLNPHYNTDPKMSEECREWWSRKTLNEKVEIFNTYSYVVKYNDPKRMDKMFYLSNLKPHP